MTDGRWLVVRYYLYRVSNSYGFFQPGSIIYLHQVEEFGLELVAVLQGIAMVTQVAAEIPTGYVGDRVGRRASQAVANGLSALGMVAYPFADAAVTFLASKMLHSIGWTFRSGTGDA